VHFTNRKNAPFLLFHMTRDATRLKRSRCSGGPPEENMISGSSILTAIVAVRRAVSSPVPAPASI
jgi:hypothetical protein